MKLNPIQTCDQECRGSYTPPSHNYLTCIKRNPTQAYDQECRAQKYLRGIKLNPTYSYAQDCRSHTPHHLITILLYNEWNLTVHTSKHSTLWTSSNVKNLTLYTRCKFGCHMTVPAVKLDRPQCKNTGIRDKSPGDAITLYRHPRNLKSITAHPLTEM